MTYSQGGLIQGLDYNTFVQGGASVNHAVANINTVWGVGSGQRGYGQSSTLATVTGGTDTVTATQWSTLISRLNSALTHQAGSGSGITAPTAGATIAYLSTLSGKITDAYNNALVAATNGTDITGTAPAAATWNTSTPTTLTITRTATFASADQARYFFNAGGKLVFTVTSTGSAGTAKETTWTTLLNTNLASHVVDYTNNSRGGTGGTQTAFTGTIGYYDLTTSYQNMLVLNSGSATADYSSNTATLAIKSNGVQGSNGDVGTVVTFQLSLVDAAADTNTAPTNPGLPGGSAPVQGNFNDNINLSITTNITVRPPETTNLTNTWGTVTIG